MTKKAKKAPRQYGEGSISFNKATGRWIANLSVTGPNGKRQRVTRTCKSEEEAKAALIRMKAASIDHALPSPQKVTLGEFLDTWLNDIVRTSLEPATYIQYETISRLHIKPFLGHYQLSKLEIPMMQRYFSRLEQEGRSPQLRRKVHVVLNVALQTAVNWEYVHRNVMERVTRPKVHRSEAKAMTAPQAAQFLKAAKEDRLFALYHLALATGMRQGELLALHWSDIDLDAGTIAVRKSLLEIRKRYMEALNLDQPLTRTITKSKTGRRTVDLPFESINVLREHRERMLAEGLNSEWVFVSSEGTPIRKSNLINKSLKPLLAKAGLPHFPFHALRHTHATLLFSLKTHPKLVQQRLGHSQVQLTLDTYTHAVPSLNHEVANQLQSLFEKMGETEG
jgi:integrase